MQWLVKLVIAAIGIPPIYEGRGSYTLPDFIVGDFTADDTWRELDLSGIVPEGVTGVHIRCIGIHANVSKVVKFREKGTGDSLHKCEIRTQVANQAINAHFVTAISSDRKIEYFMNAPNWTKFGLVVRGWWYK